MTHGLFLTQKSRICFMGGERKNESCLTLCNPVDCSLPGSYVHEISQARILEWVAISFSQGSSQTRNCTWVSYTAGRCFTIWATREILMGGGQLLSQALLIYRWIANPCPYRCLHLYSSRHDGPSTQRTPGQGAWDHSTGLKSWRRCRSLPAGKSREGLPEARAHARHHLAGLRRENGARPWLYSLIPLGAGSWVGACVLLITQETKLILGASGMQMTHITSSAKELRAGRNLELEPAFFE